jgi:thioester reductase-like protein
MTPGVLVTGVTGFLGREVARRLLVIGRPLLVLGRARDGVPAAARLASALGTSPDDPRVRVVEGDLSAPGCGIGDASWRFLGASVETVIHCAGETAFVPARREPYEVAHVAGPCHLLERLAQARLRRFVHVSTAYVCGRRTGVILESEGDVGQSFHNAYEWVKLAAESALRAAGIRTGVDVRVARPSVIVGAAPETAGGTPTNLFFEFIRMTASLASVAGARRVPLRITAAPLAPFNLVPVEYVAGALVHLAHARAGDGGTFHLVAHNPPTQAEALETIAERIGVRGLSLVPRLDAPTALERRLAVRLETYREYLAQCLIFNDVNARQILPTEILAGGTLSRLTLHRLIDLALTAEAAGGPRERHLALSSSGGGLSPA